MSSKWAQIAQIIKPNSLPSIGQIALICDYLDFSQNAVSRPLDWPVLHSGQAPRFRPVQSRVDVSRSLSRSFLEGQVPLVTPSFAHSTRHILYEHLQFLRLVNFVPQFTRTTELEVLGGIPSPIPPGPNARQAGLSRLCGAKLGEAAPPPAPRLYGTSSLEFRDHKGPCYGGPGGPLYCCSSPTHLPRAFVPQALVRWVVLSVRLVRSSGPSLIVLSVSYFDL